MRFLITGGAGFIGSAVVRYLLQHTPHSVINLDKLTYAGNLGNLDAVSQSSRYVFEQVDICDAQQLTRIFQQHQPDAVMHLAAESHVDRSIDAPAAFMQTNIIGTYTLLTAALRYWQALDSAQQSDFRFHHISTDEVYGDLPHPDDTPDAHNQRFNENTGYAPSSPYSASKASADHLVRAWHKTYGLPTIVSNCTNNYGPYHFPEKLIPHILLNALQGNPLPIYGKGDQIRDWLYVEDHAKALYTIITQGKTGHTYGVGGNCEKRNIEVVETICDLLQAKIPPGQHPMWKTSKAITHYRELITNVPDRVGHDRRYAMDTHKIEQSLHWKPTQTFESGLDRTVQWYLDNPDWWQNVLNGNYQLTRLGCNTGEANQ